MVPSNYLRYSVPINRKRPELYVLSCGSAICVSVIVGDVCDGVQRTEQTHREPGGAEGDSTGTRGGSTVYGHQRRFGRRRLLVIHTVINFLTRQKQTLVVRGVFESQTVLLELSEQNLGRAQSGWNKYLHTVSRPTSYKH